MASPTELCIFTPTFNRAYRLENLFNSLCRQQQGKFTWLIVDDGSTDATEQLVEDLTTRAPFPIRYIKQKNGGKQRAFNTGVAHCDCELFMCVDDDDIMPDGAVETVLSRWAEVRDNPKIAGIIGMCGKDADTPLASSIPSNLGITTMWDLYYKHHHRGDTALVHRTSILSQYPFEVAPGEKFIAETFVFHKIDRSYNLAVIHKVLIIREYLQDGYTANVRKITRENPVGYMKLKRMYIEYADTISHQYYESILYLVGCHFAKQRHAIVDAPAPVLAALAWLPAQVLCHTVYRPK